MGHALLTILVTTLFAVSSYQQSCSISNNKDINQPNLAAIRGQQDNCCNICRNTQNCKGFAWNSFEGGTCWLKGDTGPLIFKSGVNVGILNDEQSFQIENNQDIDLPNLQAVNGQAQSNCCSICRNTKNCKGFAWNSFEGGTCWLKAGTGPLIPKNGVNVGFLSGGGGGPGTVALVSFDEFTKAVVNSNGYPRPSQAQYNSFIQGLPKGQITTKQEAAMALTQFHHESDGLRAKEEYRCKGNGCQGEYATPGCDVNGQRYFGRGYIQLTWCGNYRAASQDLYGDSRLVSNPGLVASDENAAWDTAYWFWKINVHSRPGISEGRFGASTKAINGPLECDNVGGQGIARHRYDMYVKVRAAFGLNGSGDERGCYN